MGPLCLWQCVELATHWETKLMVHVDEYMICLVYFREPFSETIALFWVLELTILGITLHFENLLKIRATSSPSLFYSVPHSQAGSENPGNPPHVGGKLVVHSVNQRLACPPAHP